jgi:hypothetical protein
MGFIDSKIQKYSIDEVADDLVEKVTEEPRYVIEQSLEERVVSLDSQVTYLTQTVYNLQANNNSIYTIDKILLLITLYRVGLELYNLFFDTF